MKAPWSRLRATEPRHGSLDARALLISIQPRFAEAILSGTKTIELRRTMPTLPVGACALIYSSTPVKAIVGWAVVEDIIETSPTRLWKDHRHLTGVTSSEFRSYFEGRSTAYGLRLGDVQRADLPLPLAGLRSYGLEPPQSWRYVTADLTEMLQRTMSQPESAAPTSPLLSRLLGARS